jgi:hypothetical protein
MTVVYFVDLNVNSSISTTSKGTNGINIIAIPIPHDPETRLSVVIINSPS